mgnify:FL=1|jgi:hypothetical protein|tara:strand:- start:456 stop:1031 length:576 start_codon:yes stop_codon:yes gene_type:complete
MLTGEKMDRQYRLALLILLIPLITLAASTLTYYLGYKPTEINANGMPIKPQIETKNLNLIEENGNKFIFEPGKWYFVYFDDFNNEEFSLDRYTIARSSKATLRRESHRLRRLVIYKDKEMFNQAENLRAKFPEVIFLYDEDNLFKKSISENLSDPYMSKSMFLVDSFALVVWEFNVNLSFSDIFEDLEKLL